MWNFLQGVSPPVKKVKLTDEEKNEKKKVYDREKRSRGFQQEWKKKFSWLCYDETKNEMTCTVCLKYETNGNFVTGCSNFRHSTLLTHHESESHRNCCRKEDALNKPIGSSIAEKTFKILNNAAFHKLAYLFRNAHYIAKMSRPYTDFVSLCQLDKAKGIDIGETYVNDRYCQTFIKSIADAERKKQDEVILCSPFLAVISDGSTDVSSTEAEICYVRVSVNCQVSTHFIGIKNVGKPDAYNISTSLISMLDTRFGLKWRNKLVAMGTDGAAVMLGKKGGVVQRIREELNRPSIFAVHCSGHRLELAYRDGVKGLNLHDKCMTLLLNLYLFYRCSPLNRSNLKTSFQTLGKTVLIPTRIGGTRWLPHTERALQHLLVGYEAIVLHLEQMQSPQDGISRKEASAKARNFLKLLKDKRLVYWLHLLMDVIKCLSTVALCIQDKDSTLSGVWLELKSAKKILTKYKTSEGPYLRKFITAEGCTPPNVETIRQTLLSSLVKALEDRFDGDLPLFRDSSFLNILTWPEELDDYSDDEVQQLATTCKDAIVSSLGTAGYDPHAVESEWARLKTELQNEPCKSVRSRKWTEMYELYGTKFPNLFVLVNFLLTLPASSVDAERGFSKMKLTKNDWRSTLKDTNLSDLMVVNMVSEDVGFFNPEPAVNLWASAGSRRPFFNDSIKPKASTSVCVDTEDIVTEDNDILEEEVPVHDEEVDMVVEGAEVEEVLNSCDTDYHEDEFYRTKDILELQKKSYKLLLSMMD